MRYVFLLPGPPSASMLSAARSVLTLVCFTPLLVASRAETAAEPPAFWRAAAELTTYNALYEGLLNIAVDYTDATRASFLFESSLLFTPLLSSALGVRVRGVTWAGAAVAGGGVMLLAADGLEQAGAGGPLALGSGDAASIAAALCYSLYVLRIGALSKQGLANDLTQGVKCAFMAVAYCGWASVDVARATIAAPDHDIAAAALALWPGAATSVAAWATTMYTAAVPGALADVLQSRAQASVQPADAQVLLGTEPLWTALLGAALLGERMSPRGWAGAALLVAALGISSGAAQRLVSLATSAGQPGDANSADENK